MSRNHASLPEYRIASFSVYRIFYITIRHRWLFLKCMINYKRNGVFHMYDPITAYVKQHITVTKSSQAANAILLLAAVCTAMSTFFVVTNLSWFLATLQYIAAEQRTSYLSTLFMYGCCTLAALISIVIMIQYYLLQWHTHAALIQRSLYWGILFLTMIPGYMILMYVASSTDLMDICMPSAESIPTRSGHLCSVHAPPPAAVTRATAAIAVYGTACCSGIHPYRFGMSLSNRLPTVLSQKGRICRIRANGL